jgi:nucleoside-diphosphate-sugar epimerase
MDTVRQVIIFGGTGFIGTHLAQHFLDEGLVNKITLVDLLPPRIEAHTTLLQKCLQSGKVTFIQSDVRQPIPASVVSPDADIIFNLASIHREPGHAPQQYFETNIPGAENICAFASAARCNRVVFLSSIAVYGPSEKMKDEQSLPVPVTPYGRSKLEAEEIHQTWQAANPERRLLILRPGVVFGPGEKGNVTRLIRSIVNRYFFYMGNRTVRKAGGYVKELCLVTRFGLDYQDGSDEHKTILNFSMNPPATMQTFVDTIRRVVGRRHAPPAVSRTLLLGVAYLVDAVARIFHVDQPINPVLVRKTFRSTFVDPKRLRELGYRWKYTLEDALLDWKQDCPEDFLK